jgi:hypothetical protein
VLADVARDRAFADELIDRYVEGHRVMDYERLLKLAGLATQRRVPADDLEAPDFEILTFEAVGRTASKNQLSFRKQWLH